MSTGRRIARPLPRRTEPRGFDPGVLLALGLVAVTVILLALAALAPRAKVGATEASRTTTVSRDFSCSGGLPGATMRAGHVGPGSGSVLVDDQAAHPRPRAIRNTAAHVYAPPPAAAGAYAVRWASARGWFAAGSCPSPRAEWWFLGGSGTRSHDSVLELDNPRQGDAIVDVNVLGPKGPVNVPGLHGLRVASERSLRLDLRKVAATFGDVAVRVTALRGLVSASMPETWSRDLVSRRAHDWVTDQPAAARRTTLAGIADKASSATLVLANPTSSEAVVNLRFVGANATYAPTSRSTVRVPPGRVTTVNLDRSAIPLGVQLHSQVPVSASLRSTVGTDEVYAGVVQPVGRAGVVGLPDGIRARLVLIGGNGGGKPIVIGYDATGRSLGSRRVSVKAQAGVEVPLWPKAAAIRINAGADSPVSAAVLLEDPNGRTVATIPVTGTAGETHVPAVGQGW